MGEIDRRLDEIARQQHGVFSRIQVLRLGGDHGFIGYRLASGKWIRMGMSVYSLASAPPSWLRALMVAVLSTPSAVVSGRAAAALHQMEGFGECRPEITTPPTANARSPLARICRSEYFNELFVTSVASVPVTTIEEAIFALAHRLAPARLARLVDDALVARKASLEMLMAIHDRHLGGRFKGIRKLRPLIEQRCEDGYVPSATSWSHCCSPPSTIPESPLIAADPTWSCRTGPYSSQTASSTIGGSPFKPTGVAGTLALVTSSGTGTSTISWWRPVFGCSGSLGRR